MTGESWKIYWREYSASTYLYGTELIFHAKDDVEFNNRLMPPGTIMKEWFSKTNYQSTNIEPTLPIIDGESTYRIHVHMDCPKGEECLVRLLFFDRYEEEAGCIFIRDEVETFRCPLKTYSYRMQLISGGVTSVHFHSVVIEEVPDEEE